LIPLSKHTYLSIIFRFAPSPTGSLHVGGARTALYNWLVAKKGQLEHSSPTSEAAFVLRVEDTDVARSTRESEESVLADLSWLGLTWDEGPDMPLGKYGPYRQSEREYIYKQIASRLIDEGKAYPCFCTTEELDVMKANMEAMGVPPRYDGTWRDANPELVKEKMAANVPYTVRFKVPPGARVVIDDAVRGTVSWDAEATVGDFILLRSSGIPVYNFCVAVDDAAMGITTVIRAEEHLTNTLRQGLILDALGVPRPRYAHCSLILGDDRQKLSKRHGATSCNQFRLDGFLPDAMINYLALLGWNDGTDNEIYTRDELIDIFDVDRINASPSVFDMDKLKWVNSQHLKRMAVEDILHLVEEQLLALNVMTSSSDVDDKLRREFVFACTTLAKQMMETTQDAATNAISVLGYDLPSTFNDLPEGSEARMMVVRGNFYTIAMRLVEMYNANNFPMPRNDDLLAAFVDVASGTPIIEDTQLGGDAGSYPQEYKTSMKAMAKEMNIKGKELFHPIRLALTGSMSGQDVTKQLSLLAMAEQDGTVVNIDSVGLVPFNVRMERLRAFCDTIPMEYRMTEEQTTTGKANNASTKNDVSSMTKDGLTNNGGEKSNMDKSGTRSMSSSSLSSTTDPLDTYKGPPITALDIRVGRITKVWAHEESEKLFCEEIDVGEGEPRLIASGLRPYMSAENLDGRLVLVLCNLKERKLAGFPSHGMVLCASNEDHTEVKLVSVPVEAKVGERVTIPGVDFELESAAPFAENKIGKQKVFEKIAPFLRTGEYGVPEFCGRPLMTSAGVCTSSITNGSVS
jgi:glutamyl-tRNA synthetase